MCLANRAMSRLAQNRHQTYSLISRLFTQGLTEGDLETVLQIDVLARHLPAPFDPDESATRSKNNISLPDSCRLFSFERVCRKIPC